MQLTAEMLTGRSYAHVVAFDVIFDASITRAHFLQKEALIAFQGLQEEGKKYGFQIIPASSFRDFERQLMIWNKKFSGIRKVHDDEGQALDLSNLDDWQKAQKILRWSALPGASRHHWGTEIDIYDPFLIPQGQSLQLEPWEYEKGGYFAELSDFLQQNLAKFDFALPFMQLPEHKHIGYEPWHISYQPLAEICQTTFQAEMLLQSWNNVQLLGLSTLKEHLEDIFTNFIV